VPSAANVVTWEGGATTDRCVASLLAQEHPPSMVVVVDNASGAAERARLATAFGSRPGVRLLLLDTNRQFAGGLNMGAAVALASGADRLLCLNNDTVLAPEALGLLERALDERSGAGIAGPRILDLGNPNHVISAGERFALPALCLPRTWLRYRRRTLAPYRVSGILGCAMLVTRVCFEAVGGFVEEIQVYYEDVDFCLAARGRGFETIVMPTAIVYHDGLRGFAGGLTPWAAFLKARNPWIVLRRHGGPATWPGFVLTYGAMVVGSAALHALRGEPEIVRALGKGTLAGLRAVRKAAPPVGAPR
jgi:hypothetical protein